MSLYSASRCVSLDKYKIRGRYLGRHMHHLADSIAKLSQGRENWYIVLGENVNSSLYPIFNSLRVYRSVYRPKSECVWIVLCFEQGTQVLG